MGISDSLGINSIAIRLISCCFVIVTRGDLREEFSMADDAFALSPISARASLPSEEDYAAIAEAFMETSRGRWFLTEYAKRNRNADTRMVLDAVARIEQGLAAQKEESLQKEANLHREENLLRESFGGAPAAGRRRRGRCNRREKQSERCASRHARRGRGSPAIRCRSARQPRAGSAPGTGAQGRAGAAGDCLAAARDRQ